MVFTSLLAIGFSGCDLIIVILIVIILSSVSGVSFPVTSPCWGFQLALRRPESIANWYYPLTKSSVLLKCLWDTLLLSFIPSGAFVPASKNRKVHRLEDIKDYSSMTIHLSGSHCIICAIFTPTTHTHSFECLDQFSTIMSLLESPHSICVQRYIILSTVP